MIKLFILVLLCSFYLGDSVIYFNCDDDPCQNGKCKDLYRKTAYECECEYGWTGENCDKPVEDLNNENGPVTKKSTTTNNNYNEFGIDSQIEDFEHNKCGGECENGGTCNKITGVCQCRNYFHGDYCDHHSLIHTGGDVEKIYSNYDQCNHKCAKNLFTNRHVCHYKYMDSTKACHCYSEDERIKKVCSPVMNNFETCQLDCKQRHNKTRACIFFYQKSLVVRTCNCVDTDEMCSIYLPDEEPTNPIIASIKAGFVFLSIVVIFYVTRIIVMRCIEVFSENLNCLKSQRNTEYNEASMQQPQDKNLRKSVVSDANSDNELYKYDNRLIESQNV